MTCTRQDREIEINFANKIPRMMEKPKSHMFSSQHLIYPLFSTFARTRKLNFKISKFTYNTPPPPTTIYSLLYEKYFIVQNKKFSYFPTTSLLHSTQHYC